MMGNSGKTGGGGTRRRGSGSDAGRDAGIITAATSIPAVSNLSSGGTEKLPFMPKKSTRSRVTPPLT